MLFFVSCLEQYATLKNGLIMNKFLKYFLISSVIGALVLLLSAPSEQDFLDQIARDYSQIHPDFQLSPDDLVNMGTTKYRSQLIFSSYTYTFGSIEVHYWGAFGNVFSSGFKNGVIREEKPKILNV